jgi:hypothetical protein
MWSNCQMCDAPCEDIYVIGCVNIFILTQLRDIPHYKGFSGLMYIIFLTTVVHWPKSPEWAQATVKIWNGGHSLSTK